jgi:hypothetical protein
MERRSRTALLGAAIALALLGANGRCQPLAGLDETVYALTADSSFARGCFPPATCPTVLAEDLGGTFRTRLVQAGGLGDLYEVRDVFWLVRFGGEDVPITGAGAYLDGVSEDQLALELRVGDEEPELYTSGPVPSGPPGSTAIDIPISIHGGMLFDTVIEVRAVAFPERAASTPCGPSGLACDTDTEVCVARTPIGPATVYACEPVPAGCEQDRGCGCAGAVLCEGAFGVCSELGENQIQCECPQCQ